jgi:hypothetical protein
MKAFEFTASINPDATLSIPSPIAQQIRQDQEVRVILLMPEPTEDRAWARLTAEQFLQGYAEGDAIYDELPAR